ncbi:leucine-rich repeat domain-containing protein [Larkinella sp. GY13]|uniref:leucine-rich repeat domain-containing protein n=1 Tax=Larkinella sp. GY13 TaxID=3453720 RepID=UPI003EE8A36F
MKLIRNAQQDTNSKAWDALCRYVDQVADNGAAEFAPLESLGADLFSQIRTLPASISRLKQVKYVWLYGSAIRVIPPEIGQMESLVNLDPYTSYRLHWFPYEITRCTNLKDSRVSTRALYGNRTNGMLFPDLNKVRIEYNSDGVHCSICRKTMAYAETDQYWITLRVGTDNLPLLVNLCSDACKQFLPAPEEGFYPNLHKGGKLVFPKSELANSRKNSSNGDSGKRATIAHSQIKSSWGKLLGVIRKNWQR